MPCFKQKRRKHVEASQPSGGNAMFRYGFTLLAAMVLVCATLVPDEALARRGGGGRGGGAHFHGGGGRAHVSRPIARHPVARTAARRGVYRGAAYGAAAVGAAAAGAAYYKRYNNNYYSDAYRD